MDRETRTIETPSGKRAELKTYITARERNELRAIFLGDMKIDVEAGKPKEITGTVVGTAEKKLLELTVVSFDGSPDSIIERLLDGTSNDYDFVVEEANKVSSGNFTQAK